MTQTISHHPVMLHEIIEALNIIPDGIYVDGTFGRGGHSKAILERLNDQGKLICFDKDPDAIAYGKALFDQDKRVHFFQSCFSQLPNILAKLELQNKVQGLLLDLGVSSPQLDNAIRGFSFMREGPLDMRMDPTQGQSAADWINEANQSEIEHILKRYGEEPLAKRIAKAIIAQRQIAPILTTTHLADIVAQATPAKKWSKQPAARTFQAIRIHINQELQAIDHILNAAPQILAPAGRIAMLSFHSLEDRKVKQYFREQSRVALPFGIAIPQNEIHTPLNWIIKRQRAGVDEIASNPRARSATLRVAQKGMAC